MTLNEKNVLKQADGVNPVDFGDELALFNIKTSEYFVINEVGKAIWILLDGSNTISEITNKLIEDYEVKSDVCQESVIKFVNEILIEGLVQEVA